MRSLIRSAQRASRTKAITGIVRDVLGNKCSVSLSTNGKALVGIPYSGAAPRVGDTVIVDFKTSSIPMAITNIPPVSAEPAQVFSILTIVPPVPPPGEAPAYKLGPIMTLASRDGELEIGASPFKIYNRFGSDRYILEVFLSVGTAPTGDDIIVDVKVDSASIFALQVDMPTILAGNTTGSDTIIDLPVWSGTSYLSWEIIQVGSSAPGSDLMVHITHTYSNISMGSGS